jgi:hypothetical protein
MKRFIWIQSTGICLLLLLSSLAIQSQIIFLNENNQNQMLQKETSIPDLLSQINQSQLENYLKMIQSFGPHPTGSTALRNLQSYLYTTLSNMTLSVSNHTWASVGLTGTNIIAIIPGTISPENIFIICAHTDTVDVSPGVDDDGSGIAAILMMASILCKYTFNSTIEFILFSGEEQGTHGSIAYATEAKIQQKNIIGVLSLDKIGYAKTTEDGSIIRHHADPASSWMIDLTDSLSSKYQDLIDLTILPLPFDASSDHKPFVDQGYSGSNFVEHVLNPHYHTSEDILEHINLTYLTKVCKLALSTIVTIAQTNSMHTQEDIDITIQGKLGNENNARLSITLKNNLYPDESLTISITIEINHLLSKKPVMIKKEFYSIPCIWQFTKDLNQSWSFHLGPQTYSVGFFILSVSIHGVQDDYSLSLKTYTYGIIFPAYNLMIIPQS